MTVTPRSWHTNPAAAAGVPNGQLTVNEVTCTLPVPPAAGPNPACGGGLDTTGLGAFGEQISFGGGATTTVQTGPNNGFIFFSASPTFTTFAQYIINPDLLNSASVFSQSQFGHYNSQTDPGGCISYSNLLTQTQRHEYNSTTQSHWAFYVNAMNMTSPVYNPGDYVEAQFALPGTSQSGFATATTDGVQGNVNDITTATRVEPFAVNQDASGNFLGYINYAPYNICN
jgi:hypothetical protein